MGNQWTQEQKEAITQRNKNLLVSAAAGSGKTAVMVERIATLMIEERVPIDALLVVTFTNAAAGEMKERIQKKLQEKRRELLTGEDKYENKALISFITEQIQNIQGAAISTLHAFCIDILRDNFQLAGLDPRFRLINESMGAILTAQALDNVLERNYTEARPSFIGLVESYGGSKDDSSLTDLVKTISHFIQAQPDQEGWLNRQKAFYKKFEDFQTNEEAIDYLLGLPMGASYLSGAREAIRLASEDLFLAQVLAQGEPAMPSLFNIEDDLRQLLSIREKLDQGASVEVLGELLSVEYTRYKSPTKAIKEAYDEEELKRVKDLRDEAKDKIKKEQDKYRTYFTDSFLADMQHLSKMAHALIDLVLEYKREYQRLKQENSVVDFSDLEHLALKVLENEEVQKSLQDKFKYIFFDEYQDTNLVQETIIERIKREDNLFFVGDVKQSIYRFRLADPTIFNKKYDLYQEDGASQKIDLSKNFRSRKEILAFCNLIFKNIMSEKYGEVDYSNTDHQLQPGKEFEAGGDHIELAIIQKEKNQYHLVEDAQADGAKKKKGKIILAEEAGEDMDAATLQATYIACKIRELAKEGVAYKDMAVLLRSPKGKTKTFADTFAEYDIPLYVDYKSSNYDTLEIRSLIEYLKIIDNKKQDEALLAAMSSIFGNFQNEELLRIREHQMDFDFYKAAELYAKEENDLGQKIRAFYEQIDEDTRMERLLGLGDFIWHLAEKRGLNTYVAALESGEQRLHNIKSLVEKAREYEQAEPKGLFGFLRHIDSLLKEKVEDSDTATIIDTENVVSMMSIHKSKGLEFKVVFLCNLEKNINETDLKQNVILHNELGLGLKYINAELGVRDDNMILSMIKEQKQNEGISEEIRILYVALTRAIDKLYLVGTVDDVEKYAGKVAKNTIQNNIPKQKNYLDWMGNVLVREQKGSELRDYTGISASIHEIGASYGIRILEEADILQMAEQMSAAQAAKKDLKTLISEKAELARMSIEPFDKYALYEYPGLEQTQKRTKASVTELAKGYMREELAEEGSQEGQMLKRPLFSKASAEFKAHEIGTIIHFLMEHLPVRAYALPDLEEQIQDMIGRELLTEEEAKVIPRERILSFFESDLGQRMRRSKQVQREVSFLMREDDALIEGIIDCYFEEEGNLILLDYKTDYKIDPKRHQGQLSMYKAALEEMEGKKVKESYIYWLAHDSFSKLEI